GNVPVLDLQAVAHAFFGMNDLRISGHLMAPSCERCCDERWRHVTPLGWRRASLPSTSRPVRMVAREANACPKDNIASFGRRVRVGRVFARNGPKYPATIVVFPRGPRRAGTIQAGRERVRQVD